MKIILMLFAPVVVTMSALAMDGQSVRQAKKRHLEDAIRVAKKQREEVFCISCDPNPGLLATLEAPAISNNVQEYKLQIGSAEEGEKEYIVERRVAELSGTLKNIMEDLDSTIIPIASLHPGSAPCLVECLKQLVSVKNSLTYDDSVHAALKDLVDKTDIVHLFLATNYLDIPILFNYLASSIVTYLGKNKI